MEISAEIFMHCFGGIHPKPGGVSLKPEPENWKLKCGNGGQYGMALS
jgi:hypothetical protein